MAPVHLFAVLFFHLHSCSTTALQVEASVLPILPAFCQFSLSPVFFPALASYLLKAFLNHLPAPGAALGSFCLHTPSFLSQPFLAAVCWVCKLWEQGCLNPCHNHVHCIQ